VLFNKIFDDAQLPTGGVTPPPIPPPPPVELFKISRIFFLGDLLSYFSY
jgi:hypothetical protein